jgi:hypothetical protein|tara:strand:+ start:1056 stop:1721 length:666 start_codon:yes stop_codon:yes gene_type:complete
MTREYYVYLKTQMFEDGETDITKNTIPLRVVSASFSVSKTIPAFPVPLSGIATGESITAALDLGMADKSISLQGFLIDTTITKDRVGSGRDEDFSTLTYTAHEVAQMIASGVDSTGLAKNQAFSELVILYPSFVGNDQTQQRAGVDVNNIDTAVNVPFNFASRGDNNTSDNLGVPAKISDFPDSATAKGVTGFIRSFSFDFSAETVEVSFNLDFQVASITP